jgi:hypothetical protein
MADTRYEMQADPGLVEAAMSMLADLPVERHEAYVRAMFEAVFTYQASEDPGVLIQFARDVAGSVSAYGMPGFREAMASASAHPILPVSPVSEAFAKFA